MSPRTRPLRPLRVLPAAFLALFVASAPAAAQAVPPFYPFFDNNFALGKEFRFVLRSKGTVISVPAGFVTDFASIPSPLKPAFGKAPHDLPGLVHDYLYWRGECSQEQADRVFELALMQMGTSFVDRKALWGAVALFGKKAFEDNAKQRASGLPRIVPASYLEQIPPNLGWDKFRKRLRYLGVSIDSTGPPPSYCKV